MRVRYELRRLSARRSALPADGIHLIASAATFGGIIFLIAEIGRAPATVVDVACVITFALAVLSLITGYPLVCSSLLAGPPITPGQIAAFAELAPPEVWRRACVDIEAGLRRSPGPVSFGNVRFEVATATARLARENPIDGASEPRRGQVEAFQILGRIGSAES